MWQTHYRFSIAAIHSKQGIPIARLPRKPINLIIGCSTSTLRTQVVLQPSIKQMHFEIFSFFLYNKNQCFLICPISFGYFISKWGAFLDFSTTACLKQIPNE
jgi:hypothetical protein